MFKTTISILLLSLTISAYGDSTKSTQGIDLNEVMRLLESAPAKQAPAKTPPIAETKKPVKKADNKECTLPGKVIRVVDGDTVYVLDANKVQHNIRMAGIDAPEKGFCKHMASCAELNQCGIGRLDRDKDGIPWESICKSGC